MDRQPNQSINQSINPSITQSINQSINQSIMAVTEMWIAARQAHSRNR
jgi:hypothetical protein